MFFPELLAETLFAFSSVCVFWLTVPFTVFKTISRISSDLSLTLLSFTSTYKDPYDYTGPTQNFPRINFFIFIV